MANASRFASSTPGPNPSGLEALEHPLPLGMRDLLPEEAVEQAVVGGKVLECFELFGYQRISVPAFEYAGVLEKGLGALDAGALLRFVEPETGEVVALRPDMTPQIARLIVTRLRDVPSPVRLCYQGSVLRRRQERARQRRQIQQIGFELIGAEQEAGDFEVLEAATAAIRAAGLLEFTLDIGHAQIAAALLADVSRERRGPVLEALSMKDSSELLRRGKELGFDSRRLDALAQLPDLHGGDEIWPRAVKVLGGTPAEAPASRLRRLWDWANERKLATGMIVDLGEVSRFDYYTGVTFNVLANGPGEALGSGGRYDGLFAQFNAPRSAAGFAVDLGNVCWALGRSGHVVPGRVRWLVVPGGSVPEQLVDRLLGKLRSVGVACTTCSDVEADGYARAWGYDAVLAFEPERATLKTVSTAHTLALDVTSEERLTASALAALSSTRNG